MEPILMSVATALATKAATGLFDLVKSRFAKHPEEAKALEAATAVEAPTEQSPQVVALAQALERVTRADPEFDTALRAEWVRASVDQHGKVNNQITGTVTGKVIQAGDIHGNITF